MNAHSNDHPNRLTRIISIIILAGLIGYYLYLLRTGEAQQLLKSIQNLGAPGVLIGIFIQSVVNVIPVPGEFISVILMEIYGPVWGGIYSWIGGMAGALGALFLTKWIAKPYFGKLAQPFLVKMDEFTKRHEAFGLLLLRFVPFVPYHFVNYAAGLASVKIWNFTWTTGIGILPYTIAFSGLYAGVRHGSLIWGIIGVCVFLLLLILSWWIRRKREVIKN